MKVLIFRLVENVCEIGCFITAFINGFGVALTL